MKTKKVTLMEDLKTKSRSFQKKFSKKRGACINPLHSKQPLQPRKVNQLTPNMFLQGRSKQINHDNPNDSKNGKKGGKIGSKTFLYVKTSDYKNGPNMNNSSEDGKPPLISMCKKHADNFSFATKKLEEKNRSAILIDLPSNRGIIPSQKVMWNPSTNLASKRKDIMVERKTIKRLGSLNEGGGHFLVIDRRAQGLRDHQEQHA